MDQTIPGGSMRLGFIVAGLLILSPHLWAANDRETRVRNDRERVEGDEHWIYGIARE